MNLFIRVVILWYSSNWSCPLILFFHGFILWSLFLELSSALELKSEPIPSGCIYHPSIWPVIIYIIRFILWFNSSLKFTFRSFHQLNWPLNLFLPGVILSSSSSMELSSDPFHLVVFRWSPLFLELSSDYIHSWSWPFIPFIPGDVFWLSSSLELSSYSLPHWGCHLILFLFRLRERELQLQSDLTTASREINRLRLNVKREEGSLSQGLARQHWMMAQCSVWDCSGSTEDWLSAQSD